MYELPLHQQRRDEVYNISLEMMKGNNTVPVQASREGMITFLNNSEKFRRLHPPPISRTEHGYFRLHYKSDEGEEIDIEFYGSTLCKTRLVYKYPDTHKLNERYMESTTILNTWLDIRYRGLVGLM